MHQNSKCDLLGRDYLNAQLRLKLKRKPTKARHSSERGGAMQFLQQCCWETQVQTVLCIQVWNIAIPHLLRVQFGNMPQ
jgi:hypothetical protein